MEGDVSETFRAAFINFADEYITILGSVSVLVLMAIIIYWLYNRKKYHELKHQIPASVVKNYLDSIIQNSSALKSSLFRGGGLDVGVPSVVPVGNIGGGDNVGVSDEALNQKNAEISSLSHQITEKSRVIQDLEGKVADLEGQVKAASSGDSGEIIAAKDKEIAELKAKIAELEAKLKEAESNSGGGADPEQVATLTKERDELKERLQEYEIIEDDLANLKKLQQENEQLKKSLEAAGGAAPAAAEPAAAPAPEPEAAPEPEPPAAEAAPAEEEPEPAPSGDDPALEGEEKSAEDLLNEFEKMLG